MLEDQPTILEHSTPEEESMEDQPNFGKILLATFVGILLLGGITYAGYRYSQMKATQSTQGSNGCEQCVTGTNIRFDGWDLNKNGKLDDCNEACKAYWGPSCGGASYCSNVGSTDPGSCCTCITSSGDACQ